MYSAIQKVQQENIDSHERTKLERMLVVSLKVLYSAVSQITSLKLPEGTLVQLQARLSSLDPLRKVETLFTIIFNCESLAINPLYNS